MKMKKPGEKKSRIVWVLKQLIPLTYWTKHQEKGKKYFTIWKMFLGRSYDVCRMEIK